jgi:hypothetical protein
MIPGRARIRGASATAAPDVPSVRQPRPIVALAVVGALIFAFMVFVLGRWIFGPNFKSTPTGPDPISDGQGALLVALQIAIPIGALVCMWFWVGKPWLRERRLTTNSMFVLAGSMLFF